MLRNRKFLISWRSFWLEIVNNGQLCNISSDDKSHRGKKLRKYEEVSCFRLGREWHPDKGHSNRECDMAVLCIFLSEELQKQAICKFRGTKWRHALFFQHPGGQSRVGRWILQRKEGQNIKSNRLATSHMQSSQP